MQQPQLRNLSKEGQDAHFKEIQRQQTLLDQLRFEKANIERQIKSKTK